MSHRDSGGKKKKKKKGIPPFFFTTFPAIFSLPLACKVEIVSSPRCSIFISAVNAFRIGAEIPPFKRPIPTSGYQRRNEARAFFLPRFARRSQKLVNHTETASWEICSDTLGQLKYPKVGEKLAHSPCPPPCGGSDAQQFLQQALINLIRRP